MKRVISFSLWGDNPRYTVGALKNIQLAEKHYPGWICRFYVGTSVPVDILDKLRAKAEVIDMKVPGDWRGMLWRFTAIADEDVEAMICRDTDSRLSMREALAVEEWLASDKLFHIMKDHPYHNIPIPGGMWGARGDALPQIRQWVFSATVSNRWQCDQDWLARHIWPFVRSNHMFHGEVCGGKKFPGTERDPKHFVGQAYAGDDRILDET